MLGSALWSGLRVLKLLLVFIQDDDVLAGNKLKGPLQLLERSSSGDQAKITLLETCIV